MEAIANSVDQVLLDDFNYSKFKPGANYVTDRRSVTFWPSGSNVYKPREGTKLIKIQINGDGGLLDPRTVRVMYTLRNTDPNSLHKLRTVGGPWSFFRRARLLAGGASCEDIDEYNRIHEMFSTLESEGKRNNDDIEGFGIRYDKAGVVLNEANYPGIESNKEKTVLFKPMFGLFNQSKMIPIRYCPLTMELELVTNPEDCVIIGGAAGDPAPAFLASNSSTSWEIVDVQLKCDLLTLDNAVDNQMVEKLLSGKSININYNTYVSQSQSISGRNSSVPITRALTRLKNIFVTFDGLRVDEATRLHWYKEFNDFYHPNSYSVTDYDSDKELEIQVQVGSKLFPEYPIRSLSESFYQLVKCLGLSSLRDVSLTNDSYRTHNFILGLDTEKVLQAGFTGLNTKAGDLLSVKVKNDSRNAVESSFPTKMHVVLNADQVLEVRDGGCTVYD